MTTHTPAAAAPLIDPRAEANLLNKYGLSYSERKVPLSEIDYDYSFDLNYRSETRANPDTIAEYAIKMLDGEIFPFPVLSYDPARKAFLIWSGVHRIGAHREIHSDLVDAFVVDVPVGNASEVLLKLRQLAAEANTRHGVGTSHAERLHAACDELVIGGDLGEISSRFGLDPEEIKKGVKERELNFSLRQHGIDPDTLVRFSDKEAVLRCPDERLMRDVASFVKRHTLREKGAKVKVTVTQGEVNELVKELRREKSPTARNQILEDAEVSANSARPKKVSSSKRGAASPLFMWRGAMTRLTRELDERELVRLASTADGLDKLYHDVKAIRGVLDNVERAIERHR